MALIIKDRVKETTTTTGTIPFVLGGAVNEYQTFSSTIGNANTTPYAVEDVGGINWEVGIGQYVSSNNSLIRQTILASSNNNSIVNFSAGPKNIFVTVPADYTALTSRDLTQFAPTTSANLASIISEETGTGSLVFADNAVLSNTTISGTFTATGTLAVSGTLSGTSTVNLVGSTTSTTSLGTAATTGTTQIGGTTQTGTITVGRSTATQTLNLGTGATSSGSIKTINIGTAGVAGSNTNINIGSAASGATNVININGQTSIGSATSRVGIGTDSGGSISLGRLDNTASLPYIDFNSGATTVDYDTRIIATAGNGTVGNGSLGILTGAVGIGTASPTSKLDVAGSVKISQDLSVSGNVYISGNTSTVTVSDQTGFKEVASVLPSINPTLNIDFANSTVLDPRITFSRETAATYYNQFGILTTSAINEPRFNYDTVTLQAKGLLIEEQRTNLLTYSSEFDNAAWGKSTGSPTVSANATTSPDGTVNADKLIEGTTLGSQSITQAPILGVLTYSLTVFAKKAERYKILLRESTTTGAAALFDLNAGLVLAVGGAGSSTPTATITKVSGGFYRCELIYTQSASGLRTNRVYVVKDDATTLANATADYLGDGTSGIYIWGAQLEAGSFPTSYIPTTSATVTRAADNASMVGSNFSSWYNMSEGTIYASADRIYTGNFVGYPYIANLSDGTNSNEIAIYGASGSLQVTTEVKVSGTQQLNYMFGVWADGFNKSAVAYKQNDTVFAFNGSTKTTDTSCNIPIVDRLNIGLRNTSNQFNGHIKSITYYPIRLSNSILQGLTA